MIKIGVVGAGQFGTAIANSLSKNSLNRVRIFSNDIGKVKEINNVHFNSVVFHNVLLSYSLQAEHDMSKLGECNVVFLAMPSH